MTGTGPEHPVMFGAGCLAMGLSVPTLRVLVRRTRSNRGCCPACGTAHDWPCSRHFVWVPRSDGARFRGSVVALSLAWLPWGLCKQAWTWGWEWFGVSDGALDYASEGGVAELLHRSGLDVTVLAAAAATVMVLALTQRRWVERLLGVKMGARVSFRQRAFRAALVAPVAVGVPLLGYGTLLVAYAVGWTAGLVDVPVADGLTSSATRAIIVFGGLAFAGIGAACTGTVLLLLRHTAYSCRPNAAGSDSPAPRARFHG